MDRDTSIIYVKLAPKGIMCFQVLRRKRKNLFFFGGGEYFFLEAAFFLREIVTNLFGTYEKLQY